MKRSYYVLRQITMPTGATRYSDIGYEEIATPVAASPALAAREARREHGEFTNPPREFIVIPASAVKVVRA